jgi:hypothetical protein
MTYQYDPHLPDVDLYEHLEKIRPRPVMWLGKKDIHRLAAWIGGMVTISHNSLGNGPKVYNLVSKPDFEGVSDEEPGFSTFVRKKYGLGKTTVHWADGLARVEQEFVMSIPAEERAVDRFFRDLDEFRFSPLELLAKQAE